MLKKVISLLLAVMMVAAMFVGCASNTDANKDTTAAGDKDTTAATKGDETQGNAEPVSLRFVMFGEAGQRNAEFYKNEFHDKVLEDLNIDATVEYVPWGNDQIMTMAATGEAFAFMGIPYACPLSAPGLCATFTEEMFENAPNLTAARMGHGLECVKYKGEILAVPVGSVPYAAMNDNFTVRNDILNEVGWDVSQITDYDTLMEAMAAVHEKYPELKMVNSVGDFYKALCSEIAPDGAFIKGGRPWQVVVVDENDPTDDTVISNLESEYFKNWCTMMKEWMDLGYLTVEDMTDSSVGSTAWNSGNCLLTMGYTSSIYNHRLGEIEGADVQYLKISTTPDIITRDIDWAWMLSKAAQDQAGDLVRFFDWMYASKDNYMFCMYGVEGTDWEYKEDGTVKKLTNDEFFYGWQHITMLYDAPSETVFDAEEIEKYLHYDDTAVYSKTVGFGFDETPVENEAIAINAIINEKVMPLAYGIGDYETEFPAILEELKAAGLDAYVAEYQRQFSEFMANK